MRSLVALLTLVFSASPIARAEVCEEAFTAQGADAALCRKLETSAALACALIALERLEPALSPDEVVERCSEVQQVEIPTCMTIASERHKKLDHEAFETCLDTTGYFADAATLGDLEKALTTFEGVCRPDEVRHHLERKSDFDALRLKNNVVAVASLAAVVGLPIAAILGCSLGDPGPILTAIANIPGALSLFIVGPIMYGLGYSVKAEAVIRARRHLAARAEAELERFEVALREVLDRLISRDPELAARLGKVVEVRLEVLPGETGLAFFKEVMFQQGRTRHLVRPEFEPGRGTVLALYKDNLLLDKRLGVLER